MRAGSNPLLIDIATQHGTDSIAQVDLLERVHRNQSLEALSRMAYGILQTIASRLDGTGRASVELGTAPRYMQFVRGAGGVTPDTSTITVAERPPLAALAGHTSASSQQTS
jgi:glucosyl-3-phosphoglycerate synthase